MSDQGALVARARGLSGHLLMPEQVASLCRFPPAQLTTQFAAQLVAYGAIEPAATPVRDARALELAMRRQAAARLRVLARWSANRALSLLFDDEDVRSLRALVRCIMAAVPPALRLEGLLPTPTLPLRALNQLASCGDVANLASLLIAWQSPFGAPLAIEAARPRPELFRFDLALAGTFAIRARKDAGRDRTLRHFAERIIDLANVLTMMVVSDHHVDVEPNALFLEGGKLVGPDDIAFAVGSAHRELVTQRLAPRLAGTPLAQALSTDQWRTAEDSALDALASEFVALARRDPTSLAPVIAFVLRQRAELRVLQRIVWSVSAGMPPAMIRRAIGAAA